MRPIIASIFIALLYLTHISPPSESSSLSKQKTYPSLEALYALSVSFVQVQVVIANKDREVITVPLCGDLVLCNFTSFLEQEQVQGNGHWRRTMGVLLGDVSFQRTVELKRGDTLQAAYRFNPLDHRFADDTRVRYPGKVRIVTLVWLKKEWVGHDSLALEAVSNEFDIPSPAPTWAVNPR